MRRRAVEVGRVYFTEATTGIADGDLLLFAASAATSSSKLILRAVAVSPSRA